MTPPPGEPPRSTAVMIDTGNKDELTMGLYVLPSNQRSNLDCHDVAEAYFFTRGRGYGLLWADGEDKAPFRYEIEPGTSTYIPPRVNHQTFNTGKEDMWLVWFFPKHADLLISKKLMKKPFSPEEWTPREMPVNEWYPKR